MIQDVLEILNHSESVFFALGIAYLLQVSVYFIICGLVVFICHILLKVGGIGELLDDIKLKPNQVKKEIKLSLISAFIYATFLLACIRLSPSTMPVSWFEGGVQFVLFMLFYDVMNYLTHRLFHNPRLRRFHQHHHGSVRVTPWSSACLHPVEAMANQVPFLIFVLILPVSSLMIVNFYVFLMLGMAMAHSNYNPLANLSGCLWLKRYLSFHQVHHKLGSVNYGFLGTHWDCVFATSFIGSKASTEESSV